MTAFFGSIMENANESAVNMESGWDNMEQQKLNRILELHKKWIDGQYDGECANLRRADLSSADLSSADLSGANLSHADLRGADLSHDDLSGANLRDADLSGADLSHADLRHADLSHADLSGANLSHADLRHADLSHADLSGANLSHADLSGAKLSHADLSGANIDYSCLPIWCGSLTANFDDKQLIQIAYHLCKAGLQSCNASDATKKELNKLVGFANKFHRVEECGNIEERVG